MPRANDEKKYRCKDCNHPVFQVMRLTFMCRTKGCPRNNGTAESQLCGLPDWVEEVRDAKAE